MATNITVFEVSSFEKRNSRLGFFADLHNVTIGEEIFLESLVDVEHSVLRSDQKVVHR